MILTGLLAGSSTSEFARGFWFLVSTAAMVALLYLVYTKLFSAAQSQPGSVQGACRTLALLTIVLWPLYLIVWLLGTEGFSVAPSTVEVFLFLILDILAKIGFGFLLLTNREALGQAAGGGGGGAAQASRGREHETAPHRRGSLRDPAAFLLPAASGAPGYSRNPR
jgi:bacteriorhodopsin